MAQDMTIVPGQFGEVPSVLAGVHYDPDELGGGILGSYAVVSYRGKVWRVKYRGDETDLVDDNGHPVPTIEVVIVKSSPQLSKLYYAGGWVKGSTAKPDCWSNNGVNPDSRVPQPQAASCGICPQNRFMAKLAEGGKVKTVKACGDNRRTVVLPLADLGNEAYGGPMLLRIPAASLVDLSKYSDALKQAGMRQQVPEPYPYFAVGTRIGFDLREEYQKLTFQAIRVLRVDEAEYVASLRNDPQVLRMLAEEAEAASDETQPHEIFEQPPEQAPAPAPAPAPTLTQRAAAPRPAPAPAPAPRPTPPRPTLVVPAPAPRPAPPPAPVPLPRRTAAPVSPIAQAMATPLRAPAPRPAPAPVEAAQANGHAGDTAEVPSEFQDDFDAALAALIK